MLDLYRARRTSSTAAESADNWHFVQMRVFIILSLSVGGLTADHTHLIFWEKAGILHCASSMPCSIHVSSWEEKVCFLREKGKISIAKQSIGQNNTGWMWAFEKVICTKWPLKLTLFLNDLGGAFQPHLSTHRAMRPISSSRGHWILEASTTADSDNGVHNRESAMSP